MVNRRLLRTKAIQSLFAYFLSPSREMNKAERELMFSIQKTYDLYNYLLRLIIELQFAAERQIERRRNKWILTNEDKNPEMKFVNIKVIKQLAENSELSSYINKHKLQWTNESDFVDRLYNQLLETEEYKEFILKDNLDYLSERDFICNYIEKYLVTNDELMQMLEEHSIFWIDDYEYVLIMVIKTIKSFSANSGVNTRLMPMFKNDDDEQFVRLLFRKAILKYDSSMALIDKYIINWDIERVAYMDKIIMLTAIAEVIEFRSIPVKVSFNEYIEIAKEYSSSKSGVFINGILDKIVIELKETKQLVKAEGVEM